MPLQPALSEKELAQSAQDKRPKALQPLLRGSAEGDCAGASNCCGLVANKCWRAGTMQLAVDSSTCGAFTIAAMPTDTLARLRARIGMHGIAPAMQCVMAGGQPLAEGPQTLEERGIGPKTTLSVVTREEEVEHLLSKEYACRQALTAAEATVVETETSVDRISVGTRWITEPTRLRLHRDDGTVKHWRWFKLTRESIFKRVGCDYIVSWGKYEDGGEHMRWASCSQVPPKRTKVKGVKITDHAYKISGDRGLLLVSAPDASTNETWTRALHAVATAVTAVTAYQRAHAALRTAEAQTRQAQAKLRETQSEPPGEQTEAADAKIVVEVLDPLYTELEHQLLDTQDWMLALHAASELRDAETRWQVAESLSKEYWSTAPQTIHDALQQTVQRARKQLHERRTTSQVQNTAEVDSIERRCQELEILTIRQQAEIERLFAAAKQEQNEIARVQKTMHRAVGKSEQIVEAGRVLLARTEQEMNRLLDECETVILAKRRTTAEHAATLHLVVRTLFCS